MPPPYPYRPEWTERFPASVAGVPGIADIATVPIADEDLARARSDAAEALEVTLQALGPDRVCAFVAEPIIGASAGAVVPDEGYWSRVRAICDRYGVLWIADEVMTGMGRTGRWLASEHWDVTPDIVALGKGMAAGYMPLGGVAIRESWWQALAAEASGFSLGFTYSQHPVAAAAGRAVLGVLRERDLPGRAENVGRLLRQRLTDELAEHPHVGEVRGRGLLLAVELVADRDDRSPFAASRDVTGMVLRAARDAGVLLYPARGGADGNAGDAFLVAPPLTITETECDELVEGIIAGLAGLPGLVGRAGLAPLRRARGRER